MAIQESRWEVYHNIAFVKLSLMESLHLNVTIVVNIVWHIGKSKRTIVNLQCFYQSTMMIHWKGFRDCRRGEKAKIQQNTFTPRGTKDKPTKSHSAWCIKLSELASLPKFFWEKTAVKLSTSPPTSFEWVLKRCIYCATTNVPPTLTQSQEFTKQPFPYAVSIKAYNTGIVHEGFQPLCWADQSQASHSRKRRIRHPHRRQGSQSVPDNIGQTLK